MLVNGSRPCCILTYIYTIYIYIPYMIHVRNMILAPQSMNVNETKTHKSMTNSLDLGLTTLHLDVYSS